MGAETDVEIAEAMLRDFSSFIVTLGEVEFYSAGAEFRDLVTLCRELAAIPLGNEIASKKAYVFLGNGHGKSTIARATESERRLKGLNAKCLDGRSGETQRELLALQRENALLTIVDD